MSEDAPDGAATERLIEEQTRLQAYLAQLGDALRPLSDPAAIEGTACRLLGEWVGADRAWYCEWREADGYVAVSQDYAREGLPSVAGRYPPTAFDWTVPLYKRERAVVITDVRTAPGIPAAGRDATLAAQLVAWIAIPLVKEGELVGALNAGSATPYAWTEAEVTLVRETAERIWAAIERGRAGAAPRASEARQAFLLRLSDALRPLTDPVAVQTTAMRMLAERLGVMRASYFEIEEDGDTFHLAARFERDATPMPERMRLSDFSPALGDAYRSGRTLTVPDTSVLGEFVDDPAPYAAIGVAAWAAVPLMRDGRLVAWIGVHSSSRREWSAAELQVLHDVAERTWGAAEHARAEAALRESEAKFRTVFESMDEGFLIHEMIRDESGRAIDYRLLEANPAHTRMTGLSRDTIGKLGSEFMPDVERFWLDIFDRVARTGVPERAENFNQSTGRWYNVQVSRVSGHDCRVAVVFDDVTARKRAELALQASEERQAFLLKLSDDFRAHPDEASVGRICTEALAAHMGVERCYITELSSERRCGIVGPELCAPGFAPIAGVHPYSGYPDAMRNLENGEPFVSADVTSDPALSETDRASIGGGLGLNAMISAPLYQGEGNSIWALTVGTAQSRAWTADDLHLVQDVGERTWAAIQRARAEAAVRQSEGRLQLALDATELAVYEWDLVSDRVTANERFREMVALGPDEPFVGARVLARGVHPDDRARVDAALGRAMDGDSAGRYAFEHRLGKPGPVGERWVLSHGQVYFAESDDDRRPVRVFGTLLDITDRKRAEANGALLAGIADDLTHLVTPDEIISAVADGWAKR